MIRNLKIFWKLMLLALITPLSVLILAGAAYYETASIKSEFDIPYTASAQAMMELAGNLQTVMERFKL